MSQKKTTIIIVICAAVLVIVPVVLGVLGILAASLYPAVNSAMRTARATNIATRGKAAWNAIVVANNEREVLGKSLLWPEKGKWDSSTAYFEYLLEGGRCEDLYPGVLDEKWCCLAGVSDDMPSEMPFLWTSNLAIGNEDIARAMIAPDSVDWSHKVTDNERVVIVTVGGASKTFNKRELTDKVFLGDIDFAALPSIDPAAFQVLRPRQ